MPPPTPNKPAIKPATDAAIDNTNNKLQFHQNLKHPL